MALEGGKRKLDIPSSSSSVSTLQFNRVDCHSFGAYSPRVGIRRLNWFASSFSPLRVMELVLRRVRDVSPVSPIGAARHTDTTLAGARV